MEHFTIFFFKSNISANALYVITVVGRGYRENDHHRLQRMCYSDARNGMTSTKFLVSRNRILKDSWSCARSRFKRCLWDRDCLVSLRSSADLRCRRPKKAIRKILVTSFNKNFRTIFYLEKSYRSATTQTEKMPSESEIESKKRVEVTPLDRLQAVGNRIEYKHIIDMFLPWPLYFVQINYFLRRINCKNYSEQGKRILDVLLRRWTYWLNYWNSISL